MKKYYNYVFCKGKAKGGLAGTQFLLMLFLCFFQYGFCDAQELDVSLSGNKLDVEKKDSILIRFYLNKPSAFDVKFVNIYGGNSLILEKGKAMKRGWQEIKLPSSKIKNAKAPSGLYRLLVDKKDPNASSVNKVTEKKGGFNSFDTQWGDPVSISNAEIDDSTGSIEFDVPKFAMVRVRIGLKDGGLFRTYNWEPMEAGRARLKWDGFDQSGKVKLLGKMKATVQVAAYGLPETCIYIRNNSKPIDLSKKTVLSNGWNKLAITDFTGNIFENTYDTDLSFDASLTKSTNQLTISFPEKKSSGKHITELWSDQNEIYVSVDGEVFVEAPNITMMNNVPVAIPPLSKGRHIIITNIIFGSESDMGNRVAIGAKELVVK